MRALAHNRISHKRLRRRGISLIELILAILIISMFLLPLSDMVTRSFVNFSASRFSLEGKWMAHVMMNGLVSQELPQYDLDQETTVQSPARLAGSGTVADFLLEVMEVDEDNYSEAQWRNFERWEYEYTKEVILVNNEQQNLIPDEDGELPDYGVDEFGNPTDAYDDDDEDEPSNYDPYEDDGLLTQEELLELPHSQVIRIRLTLWVPDQSIRDRAERIEEEGDDDDIRRYEAFNESKFTLVTFVDLDDFKGDVENKDPYTGGGGSSGSGSGGSGGSSGGGSGGGSSGGGSGGGSSGGGSGGGGSGGGSGGGGSSGS